MIRVENLKKDFGRLQVLKGVTEEIRQNEVVSIIQGVVIILVVAEAAPCHRPRPRHGTGSNAL